MDELEKMLLESEAFRLANMPTLRDQFAMAALQGALANSSSDILQFSEWAYDSYQMADAMMEARNK